MFRIPGREVIAAVVVIMVVVVALVVAAPGPGPTNPIVEPLGKMPTDVLKWHKYQFPVYPATVGCETRVAVACADGDQPCRVSIGGFQFWVEAGTVWTHIFKAKELRINPRDFRLNIVEIHDTTPGPCCEKPPWSGGTDPPCRVLAWYNVCCVNTMTECGNTLMEFGAGVANE